MAASPDEILTIHTDSDVVVVRQRVRNRATDLGFSLVDQTEVVTAASELARNVVVHGGGTVRIEALNNGSRRGLKLTFEDKGPGIADISLAMRDGYSTSGGLGLGLSGAKGLSNDPAAIIFDLLLREELLVQLKLRPETSAFPVIVVTNLQERDKALSLGADAFSNKPLDRRWLLKQLTTLTGRTPACKILVIDDDEVSRYLVRQLLPGSKAEVIEASNGAEGLRSARDEQPAAIVLDLLMPDMNGFQVLDQLKADPRTSRIPVIVSTSRLLSDDDRARLERHRVNLLPKSAFSDGTACAMLQRACSEIGLTEIWGEPQSEASEESLLQ
jgi:serine/threonine-protein kinase RsbT